MEREKSIIISRTKARELFVDFRRPDQVSGQIAEHPWTPKEITQSSLFMMLRDASFLLLFLAGFVGDKNKDARSPFEDFGSAQVHSIEVMKDVVKLENQIPLPALEALYDFVVNPQKSFSELVADKCSFYCPVMIPDAKALQKLSPLVGNDTHLLRRVHQVCVYEPSGEFGYKGFSPIAWIKKPLVRNNFKKQGELNPTLVAGLRVLPSAVNLTKAGVKFRPFEGCIMNIKFVREDGTLYLPVMKIRILTETVMRNLIAYELSSPACKEKAVRSFARLLDELIEDAKEVKLLRESGILVNWVGRDEKLVSILKSLSSSTWKPYFNPINNAKSNMHKFYEKRKLCVLWNEFLGANCSKPWLVTSAVAATALLLMTAAQVFCLFYTCNP